MLRAGSAGGPRSLTGRSVQQLKGVLHDLPEAVVEGEVVVHQVNQVVVVVDVLDNHAGGRFLFVQLGPLFDPQGKGLVLSRRGRENGGGETQLL